MIDLYLTYIYLAFILSYCDIIATTIGKWWGIAELLNCSCLLTLAYTKSALNRNGFHQSPWRDHVW